MQYEFIRLAMESARRRKYHCSGIQFWMYNDCWPAAGWSVLDYWDDRKAGWYGMASGCKPVVASLDLSDERLFRWWVCNGTPESAVGAARIAVRAMQGDTRWSRELTFHVPANTSQAVFEITRNEIAPLLGADAVFVCDVKSDGGDDRAWYFAGLSHEMKLPAASLRVTQTNEGTRGTVTIQTDHYARVVTLENNVDFSDNYFDLLPGEARTVEWTSALGPQTEPMVVTCWNRVT